jgi:hypothetical protein
MKTTKFYLAITAVSFLSWSCNKNELSQGTLQSSLSSNTQSLTAAMNSISSSTAYQVLTNADGATTLGAMKATTESASAVALDSISLSDITGVYDFNKTKKSKKWNPSLSNFFSKTADSSIMLVRLPAEKVRYPRTLLVYSPSDSALTNNYIFALSDYKYRLNFNQWDYHLASTINIKGVAAGALNIQSSNSRTKGYQFGSEFAFSNGYEAKCIYKTGDSLISIYSISKNSKVLYEEKFTAYRPSSMGGKHRERAYALTIGDIEIVRKPGMNSLDSAKVYVAGVLQSKSKVEMVDQVTDSIETSITNHKRELKITFDDGTSTTITQLLGNVTLENIRTLFVGLRQTYFATSIVDKIAWDIYRAKK